MGQLIADGKVVVRGLGQGEDATNIQPKSYSKGTTFDSYNCTDGDLVTSSDLTVKWYGVNAMACRVVRISNITTEGNTPTPVDVTANQNAALQEQGNQNQPQKPQAQVDLLQQVKSGVSKKILRYLLSECDYFEVLKETNPFVYDSIKDKIKYFSPSFHSTTPEGLNARLTFLQQCTRPGDTIPTIDGNNNLPVYNDAINTAFGAPPVLVLRIGDFWNSKIIPTNINFKFEKGTATELDFNPEGIGLQPMFCDVTLNFNFVGGHGLQGPIDRLQNALSFNYYANTEIYDERAVPTVDTTALDKQLVQAIIDQTPLVGVNSTTNVNNQQPFGKTIGDILTRNQTTSGETGTTTFTPFMTKIKTQEQEYYNTVVSFMEEVVSNYNYAVYCATVSKMNYTDGKMLAFNTAVNSPIFGKPVDYQKNIDEVFGLLIADIQTDKIPFISSGRAGKAANPASIRTFKKNYVTYVQNLKGSFQNKLTETIQKLTTVQQNLGYSIDCSNLIAGLTDAYLKSDGTPKIFNISGTTIVTGSTPSTTADTYTTLVDDLTKIANSNNSFISLASSGNILYNIKYSAGGDFPNLTQGTQMNTIEKKREYMIMCQTILNNFNDFRTKMFTGIQDASFEANFNQWYGEFTKKDFEDEQLLANNKILDFRTSVDKNYLKFTPYTDSVKRPFTFSTLPAPTTQQQTNVKNLYTTQNVDNNSKVYNLKKKFN